MRGCRRLVLFTLTVTGAALAGCQQRCCLRPGGGVLLPAAAPAAVVAPAPTTAVPFPGPPASPPALAQTAPPPAVPEAAPPPPPPVGSESFRAYDPLLQSAPDWKPQQEQTATPPEAAPRARVQLGAPSPDPARRPEVREQQTVPVAPPDPAGQRPQAPASDPPPPGVSETVPPAGDDAAAPLPVGIPQFAEVGPGLAAGLRPMLDGGLDWLQRKGYRTVVHVRPPGGDDAADRKQVEKRGLRYVSLELSPQTLSPQVVRDFLRLVSAPEGRPAFVYDRDGALAGGLWYLYFRLEEGLPDEEARVRANSLGLREDRGNAHREMWLAVQNYLSSQGG